MSLQPLENKELSWSIIGKSAPLRAEITIRKSQYRADVRQLRLQRLRERRWAAERKNRQGAAEQQPQRQQALPPPQPSQPAQSHEDRRLLENGYSPVDPQGEHTALSPAPQPHSLVLHSLEIAP